MLIKETNWISRSFISHFLITTIVLASDSFGATWLGNNGNYNDPNEWDTSTVPLLTDDIIISSGTAARIGNFERQANSLIDGGNLVVTDGRFLNARFGIADFVMTEGTLNQTGNYFIIGTNASGSFTQSGGTVNVSVDRGFFLSDGSGDTSELSVTNGTFSVVHNGSYNTDLHNTWLGRNGANDSISIEGGDFSVANTAAGPSQRRFYLTRDSVFEVNSGSATITDMQYVVVGRGRGAGTSQFTINGGECLAGVNTAVVVGGGEDGILNVAGGSLKITKSASEGGNLWINDWSSTLTAGVVLSGGSLTVEGDILIGRNATGLATFTMTGGELRATNLGIGANPNSLFEFGGGRIILEGDQTTIVDQDWFSKVPETTATFDNILNQTIIDAGAYSNWASDNITAINPSAPVGFDDDADGDGFTNGFEWILGGSPLVSDASELLSIGTNEGVTLQFDLVEATLNEVELFMDWDTDLSGDFSNSVALDLDLPQSDDGPIVTIDTTRSPSRVSIAIPASSVPDGRFFARFRVVQP